jgi:broad specificity phosphatase PhoE
MRFIFVRHPQTVSNFENRLTGVSDSPYTNEGEKQAQALIDFLSTATYDKIYSSPIRRAKYIGQNVANKLNAELNIVEWLREINFGEMEGLAFSDFVDRNIDIEEYRKNLLSFRYPNGDSWTDFYENRKNHIHKLRSDDGVCLCTSHGGAIWALTTALLDQELKEFSGKIINNASIIIVDYKDDFGQIIKRIEIDDILQGKIVHFNYWE